MAGWTKLVNLWLLYHLLCQKLTQEKKKVVKESVIFPAHKKQNENENKTEKTKHQKEKKKKGREIYNSLSLPTLFSYRNLMPLHFLNEYNYDIDNTEPSQTVLIITNSPLADS